MEMMIPGMNAASTQGGMTSPVATVKATNGASSATGGFQTALVKQMGGQPEGQATNATPVALVGASAGTAQDGTMLAELPELEQLLALIDSLIDQLDANLEEAVTQPEQNNEELAASLEGLHALLTLLGLPVIQLNPNASAPEAQSVVTDDAAPAAIPAQALKSSLQDALLQLQTVLQHGSQKQVQGLEPVVLATRQISELAALLNGANGSDGEQNVKQSDRSLPSWINQQSNTGKDVSVFLQRLSQQAIHPSLLTSAGQGIELTAQADAAVPLQSDVASVPTPVSLLAQPQVREQAPLASNSQQVSSFVMADDFADTMRGMIVQKFDIRTLNGASEARLTLYPEHLGSVDVRISMQSGVLTAVFLTETAQAKDMLENQMAQLRSSLQAQGLNVDKLEVSQTQSSSALLGHNSHDQGNRRPFRNNPEQQDNERVTDTAFEAEIEQAAIQELGYGRSINETA